MMDNSPSLDYNIRNINETWEQTVPIQPWRIKMSQESAGHVLNSIASHTLGVDTLHTRDSDSLDFYNVSVWDIKTALLAAYNAGRQPLVADLTMALYQITDYSDNEFVMAMDDDGNKCNYHIGDKLKSLDAQITLASIKSSLI